jgi:hypothetical protein
MKPNGSTEEVVDSAKNHTDSVERLKLVFDYTKFHIGLYTGTAGVLIALATFGNSFPIPVWLVKVALGALVVAGMAGGLIASNIPYCRDFESLAGEKAEPLKLWWGFSLFRLKFGFVAWLEHFAFWAAVLTIVIPFWICR